MISGATSGKGGIALAKHLASDKNEEVINGKSRGLFSEDIFSQVNELTQIAKIARAKKPLYHIHCDPSKPYTDQQYQDFFDSFEKEFGLESQAFAEVTHLKNGREHRHRVYLLVRENGTCIQLAHDYQRREKLCRLAEMANGEELTKGRHNRAVAHSLKNEGNLSASYRIADEGLTDGPPAIAIESPEARQIRERQDLERGFVESATLTAWKSSDSPSAFAQALLSQGFTLAQGRKVAVIVDGAGNIFPLARTLGNASKQEGDRISAQDVKKKLSDLELQPADTIRAEIKQANFQARLKIKNDEKFESFIQSPKEDRFKKFEFDEDKIRAQLRDKIKAYQEKPKDFSKMSKEQMIAEQARIIAEMIIELIARIFGTTTIIRNPENDPEHRIKQILEQRRLDWNGRQDNRQELERICFDEFKRQVGNLTNSVGRVSEPKEYREPFASVEPIGTIRIEQDRHLDRASGSLDEESHPDREQNRRIVDAEIIAEFQFNQGLKKHEKKLQELIKGLSGYSQIQKIALRKLKDDVSNIWAKIETFEKYQDKDGKFIPPINHKNLSDKEIQEIIKKNERDSINELKQEIESKRKEIKEIGQQINMWDHFKGEKSPRFIAIKAIGEELERIKDTLKIEENKINQRSAGSWQIKIEEKRQYLEKDYQRFLKDITKERALFDINEKLKKAVFKIDIEIIDTLINGNIIQARNLIRERELEEARKIELQAKQKELIKPKPIKAFSPIVQKSYEPNQEEELEEYRRPRM